MAVLEGFPLTPPPLKTFVNERALPTHTLDLSVYGTIAAFAENHRIT